MAKVAGPAQSSQAKGPVGRISYDRAGPLSTVKGRASKPCDFGPATQAVHGAMANAQQLWNTLSDIQVEEWRRFAVMHPVAEPYASRRLLTARQMFLRFNLRLLRCEFSPLLTPPLTMPTAYVRNVDPLFTVDSLVLRLQVSMSPGPFDPGYLELWTSRPLASTVRTFDKRRLYFNSLWSTSDLLLNVNMPSGGVKYAFFVRYTTTVLSATRPMYGLSLVSP